LSSAITSSRSRTRRSTLTSRRAASGRSAMITACSISIVCVGVYAGCGGFGMGADFAWRGSMASRKRQKHIHGRAKGSASGRRLYRVTDRNRACRKPAGALIGGARHLSSPFLPRRLAKSELCG
jgi:hypothetical protein